MELAFKPDLTHARANWTAFWEGRNSLPLLSAIIPRAGYEPVAKPEYTAGRDGNYTPIIDQVLRYAESHEFLGDAIPFYSIEFAADHFSALLGAELHFRDDAHGYGWTVPFVEDWDGAEIRFRPDGFWWQRTVEFAQALRQRCDGALMIGAPTLVANLDALSAIRGPQRLATDLVERPEAVHRALAQVSQAYGDILDALADLLDYPQLGSISRHGMYSPGRTTVPQCDFSCMISPAMYREFAVPHLRQEMQRLNGVEYHLDGPGAIKHLEALCEIEELGVVQWVSGAGAGESADWGWLYDKIDALGKGQIRGGDAEGVQRLWARYRSRMLFFQAHVESRHEFDALLTALERQPKG